MITVPDAAEGQIREDCGGQGGETASWTWHASLTEIALEEEERRRTGKSNYRQLSQGEMGQ